MSAQGLNFAEASGLSHLTDEQIDDHLIGDLTPEAAAHLEICDSCKARLTEAEAPLVSFQAVTLAWSERRSATLPLHPESFQQTHWPRRLAWASALAVALAVGLAVPLTRSADSGTAAPKLAQAPPSATPTAVAAVAEAPPIVIATQSAAPSTSEDQIAQDNLMLAAIDRELQSPVVSPAAFGLDTGSSRSRGTGSTPIRD